MASLKQVPLLHIAEAPGFAVVPRLRLRAQGQRSLRWSAIQRQEAKTGHPADKGDQPSNKRLVRLVAVVQNIAGHCFFAQCWISSKRSLRTAICLHGVYWDTMLQDGVDANG
jgi:hypothetical protein